MTATSATPPARPSSPSMRFIALMTPTIQSSVNGRFAQPRLIGSPKGLASTSKRNPSLNSRPATANWTRNFFQALAPRRSS